MDLALTFEDAEPFKLTVQTYVDLIEQGVIAEGSRVELIEGMIVRMNSLAVPHILLSNHLTFRLNDKLRELGLQLVCLMGPTVLMPPHNAPDPDVFVGKLARGKRWFEIEDVQLLVEVAHTTLRKDMRVKRDLYAAAGVPEYWVVDVKKEQVHRFWRPVGGVYTAEPPVPLAGELASLTIPDLAIDGSGIL